MQGAPLLRKWTKFLLQENVDVRCICGTAPSDHYGSPA